MIFYQDLNNDIHMYGPEIFNQHSKDDPLLQIAADIFCAGYKGIALHTKQLRSGGYFVAINYREDTPEGTVFGIIQADFYDGFAIPDSHVVLKKIRRVYKNRSSGEQNNM